MSAPRSNAFPLEANWPVLLRDLGVKPRAVLRRAELPEDLFSRREVSLPTPAYFRLWSAVEAEAGDPTFSIRAAEVVRSEAFHPAIFAALCSQDFTVAARRLAEYKRLVAPMQLIVDEGVDALRLELRWLDRAVVPPISLAAFELAFLLQLVRVATRERVQPLRVETPRPPTPAAEYTKFFGRPGEQSDAHALTFARADATRPFLTANEGMWPRPHPPLGRRDLVSARLRRSQLLLPGVPRLDGSNHRAGAPVAGLNAADARSSRVRGDPRRARGSAPHRACFRCSRITRTWPSSPRPLPAPASRSRWALHASPLPASRFPLPLGASRSPHPPRADESLPQSLARSIVHPRLRSIRADIASVCPSIRALLQNLFIPSMHSSMDDRAASGRRPSSQWSGAMGERSKTRKHSESGARKRRRGARPRKRPRQLGLVHAYRGRGGPRPGAGRKPGPGRRRVPHRRRRAVRRDRPLHVTLRLRDGLPRLRRREEFQRIRSAIRDAHKPAFRVVHFSVLANHVHLVVEADDRRALSRGMQGLKIRLTRRLNKLWGTTGTIFSERYHDEEIATPRQARNVLHYVIGNYRKHCAQRGVKLKARWVDPFSSARQLDGWNQPVRREPGVVEPPRTWLLRTGWKRCGLLDAHAIPPGAAAQARELVTQGRQPQCTARPPEARTRSLRPSPSRSSSRKRS